jgi:CRISPR/Cas system-associated exonuclease Cas4 (RecB family)
MSIALSWSRWSDYDQCPRKFFLKYVSKVFPPFDDTSVHLVRGRNMHKQLENYLEHKMYPKEVLMPDMSPETAALKPVIDKLKDSSLEMWPESQMAVDAQWNPVDWFHKSVKWRAIVDLGAIRSDHAIMWDYKTGKYQPYTEGCGQLHLTAAFVFKMRPQVQYVDASYLFIDAKKPESIRIDREELPKIIEIFDHRLKQVNDEVDWVAKKNEFCGWCDATKSQCRFSKKV